MVHGLLMAVASLAAEHRLEVTRRLCSRSVQALEHGFSSWGTWALVAPQYVESSWTRD